VRYLPILLLCLSITAGCASGGGGGKKRVPKSPVKARMVATSEDGYRIARDYQAVSTFINWADGHTKFAFGTKLGYLHIMNFGPGGLTLEWESPYLGASVTGVQVKDFQGKGVSEIMVCTAGGRLMMLDMQGYAIVRENAAFDLPEISYVLAEQLDDDPALEILACGGDKFAVYDGATLFKEWEAPGSVPGDWIAVGDVDGDGTLEVVLNSGYVLDAKFFRVELTLGYLGERISLMDIDSDGVDEILAEDDLGTISVYDARTPGLPEY
jgi:hypothetical protein